MSDDPRSQLRTAIMEYARTTGRSDCRTVIGDLSGMIGEIAAAAGFDPQATAESASRRIIDAARIMTEEMRQGLERAPTLAGRH
ncbi:MAG: hypothetical protein AB1714_03570 [Acidobacteriota bacterium]